MRGLNQKRPVNRSLIERATRKLEGFNRVQLSFDDIRAHCDDRSIEVIIAPFKHAHGMAFYENGSPFICVNSLLSCSEQVIALGHEYFHAVDGALAASAMLSTGKLWNLPKYERHKSICGTEFDGNWAEIEGDPKTAKQLSLNTLSANSITDGSRFPSKTTTRQHDNHALGQNWAYVWIRTMTGKLSREAGRSYREAGDRESESTGKGLPGKFRQEIIVSRVLGCKPADYQSGPFFQRCFNVLHLIDRCTSGCRQILTSRSEGREHGVENL